MLKSFKYNYFLIGLNLMLVVFVTVVSCNNREKSYDSSIDKSEFQINDRFVNLKIFVDVSKSMMKFVQKDETAYSNIFKKFIPKARARFGDQIELFEFGNVIKKVNNTLFDYIDYDKRVSTYSGTATRLDFVIQEVAKIKNNEVAIVFTDGEAEVSGGFRENMLVEEHIVEFVEFLNKGLAIEIYGFKSTWNNNNKSILRPCYIYVIGNSDLLDSFPLISDIVPFKENSILISKKLLQTKLFELEFLDEYSENVKITRAERDPFYLEFKRGGKMSPSFGCYLRGFYYKPSFIDLNSIYSKIRSCKLINNEEDEQEYDIKTENLKVSKMGLSNDSLQVTIDVRSIKESEGTFRLNMELYYKSSSMRIEVPQWIKEYSTLNQNDFTKTYFLEPIISSLINDRLLQLNDFKISEINILIEK